MRTAFSNAESTAYTLDWHLTTEMMPDEELSKGNGLKLLRQRSKQLIKDNLVAAGLLQTYINLICGVNPKIKCVSQNRIQRTQVNELIDSFRASCDVSGTQNLINLLEQVVSQSFQNGDVLINLPIDSEREGVKTVVELIESDRIDTPDEYVRYRPDVMPLVRNGVKYSTSGKVLGYYVKKFHRMGTGANTLSDYDYYPRYSGNRLVTWLFEAPLSSRPGASRKYPLLTPALCIFKQINDYQEAVIVGARVAACFAGFIETSNPAGTVESATTDSNGDSVSDKDSGRRITKLQPGLISFLRKNEKITFASPNKPSDNHDEFIVRHYKTLSMYLRIPYPVAFLDMADVNYSQWRGAMMEAMKTAGRWRTELENKFLFPVCETWVLEAVFLGLVRGNVSDAKMAVGWTSMGTLDPEKEARANKTFLQTKQKSPQQIADEMDIDYELTQQEIQEDALAQLKNQAEQLALIKELEKKHGIVMASPAKGDVPEQRNTKLRPGEAKGPKEDPDTAKERRKDDGNW